MGDREIANYDLAVKDTFTPCDRLTLLSSNRAETVGISGSQWIATRLHSCHRLDDHILEAITNLKEPRGLNRGAIAAYIEERYSAPPNFKRLLAEKLKLLTDDRKLVKVKHQYRIAPSLATLDVKENNSLLMLDDRKDNSIPKTIDTRGPTSPLRDGINCPSQAGRNDQINASLLLKGEKPDYRIFKKESS